MRDDPLIMIQSCAADRANGRQHASLDTWGAEWGHMVERRIILGDGNENPKGSELILKCPDSYATIPHKIRAAAKWAVDEGFGWVFYCDTDTYVHVPRLLRSEWDRAQYVGYQCDGQIHASGGAGHWLGPEALTALASATPNEGYGDLWIGAVLAAKGIEITHDPRYCPCEPDPIPKNLITAHLGRTTNGFHPEWMHAFHTSVLLSKLC